MLVFWVVTPCGLVGGYKRFGGHIASIFRAEDGVTTQKTNMEPQYHSRFGWGKGRRYDPNVLSGIDRRSFSTCIRSEVDIATGGTSISVTLVSWKCIVTVSKLFAVIVSRFLNVSSYVDPSLEQEIELIVLFIQCSTPVQICDLTTL
jgi:hypothetical protein